jgi:signal transduction histidine kinase
MASEVMIARLQRKPASDIPGAAMGVFSELECWNRCGSGLDAAFVQMREEFATQAHIQFRVIVQGVPRALEALIRDEVRVIGHEALSNAFRHSEADSIEVDLEYGANHLRVLVRDNGRGIDADIANSRADVCWGLWAMKERAKRIGARLRILSRMAAGTEVELLLPAEIAFETRNSVGVCWLSKLYS